jgi:hypothetical protein
MNARGKPSLLAEPERHRGVSTKVKISKEQGTGNIPGYSGYVPKSQHVAGVTYGNMTRTTLSKDFKVASADVALPPSPNHTGCSIQRPGNHVPGYTGHVAGKMDQFASTYGNMTRTAKPKGTVLSNGQYPDVGTGASITESIGTSPYNTGSKYITKKEAQAAFKQTTTGQIPGYGGFIRGGQHVAGTTFGAQTRAAQGEDFSGSYVTALPTAPNRNLSPRIDLPVSRVPGYTGFVPGKRREYGHTYGETTEKLSGGHSGGSATTTAQASKLYAARTQRFWDGVSNNSSGTTSPRTPRSPRPARQDPEESLQGGRVPGYGGFIRGQQHHAGSTYGKMTRSTKEEDFNVYEPPSLLPEAPHQGGQGSSAAHGHAGGKIPGYTGFVKNTSEAIGLSYGKMTQTPRN